jgi:hypothetical protein
MAPGIDMARALGADDHANVMEAMKEQLLIVFLKRLGGSVSVPVAEIDDTGHDNLALRLDEHHVFHFSIVSTPRDR